MEYVEGFESLEALFGYWPTFHDAEILAARFETEPYQGVSLEVRLFTWESSREVDENGFFRQYNHAEVTFRFEGCGEFRQEGFMGQNVIRALEFSRDHSPKGPIRVEFDPIIGFGAVFECDRASVVSVLPRSAPSSPSEPH